MHTTEARCAQGALRGNDAGEVLEFLGIPYAADGGRFEPARPAEPWDGVRDATRTALVFPQRAQDYALPGPDGPVAMRQREDAFCANVWTPALSGARPVLLWIHGGRWSKGSGADPSNSGAELARAQDVVVVTVNYRLGALANLDLPGVCEGNLAVGDTLAALSWVHDNAAAFGGDPENITLAGQSAGAWHAAVLAGMPQADVLFAKLLLMSAPTPSVLAGRDTRTAARRLLEELGLADEPERIRDVEAGRIVTASAAVERAMGGSGMQFAPFDDETLRLDEVFSRAAAHSQEKPLLDGVTAQEASMFLAGPLAKLPGPLYRKAVDVGTKRMFTKANDELGAQWPGAFGYRVETGSANPRLRACHCADLPLLFGNLGVWAQDPLFAGTDMARLEEPSRAFQSAVGAFMRTGNPSCEARPNWRAFRSAADRVTF